MAIESARRVPEPERRAVQRLKFRGKVEIEWGSATLVATVRDICPGGMLIDLTPPLWIGAGFVAHLAVTPAIKLNCTVRRADPGQGIGVTFEVAEESSKAQFDALLATLPPV